MFKFKNINKCYICTSLSNLSKSSSLLTTLPTLSYFVLSPLSKPPALLLALSPNYPLLSHLSTPSIQLPQCLISFPIWYLMKNTPQIFLFLLILMNTLPCLTLLLIFTYLRNRIQHEKYDHFLLIIIDHHRVFVLKLRILICFVFTIRNRMKEDICLIYKKSQLSVPLPFLCTLVIFHLLILFIFLFSLPFSFTILWCSRALTFPFTIFTFVILAFLFIFPFFLLIFSFPLILFAFSLILLAFSLVPFFFFTITFFFTLPFFFTLTFSSIISLFFLIPTFSPFIFVFFFLFQLLPFFSFISLTFPFLSLPFLSPLPLTFNFIFPHPIFSFSLFSTFIFTFMLIFLFLMLSFRFLFTFIFFFILQVLPISPT